MSKIKFNKRKENSVLIRNRFEFYYNEKFFNKWMNKFKFDGLNYQQINYIMRKFWAVGTIAMSRPVGIPNNLGIDLGEDSVIFTPYAPTSVYNIYDYPTKVNLINTRGVKFVNGAALEVDKDVVLLFCQKNHKSIYSSIECKIKQLVDLEMTMRTNTKGKKMPWLFITNPENKEAIKELADGLENDDPILFTTMEEVEKSQNALSSGAPYVLDKLEQLRQKLENDILTILGVNNVGVAEKKEHLVVDEINANNQDIQENGDDFLTLVQEGFERGNKVFGTSINVSLAHEVWYNKYEEENPQEEGDDENAQ